MTAIGLALALGTLVSEDAATLSAGLLSARGTLSAPEAVFWVSLGIWAGDLGLFAAGRLARSMRPVRRWVDRRLARSEIAALGQRLEGGVALAVFVSRFLPGTRVPLYLAAGVLRVRALLFATVTAVAVLLWVTAFVASVAWLT